MNRYERGLLTLRETLDLAADLGESGDTQWIPTLQQLLRDENGLVRSFAVKSIVLRLNERTPEMQEVCWRLLGEDESEDVRSEAVGCLASMLFGKRSLSAFERFEAQLRMPQEHWMVKATL